VLVYTKILLSLLAYYTLPLLIQLLSCSFSSQSLGQLLVLGGSRWRLAAESGCSFGVSVHRASSGGRLMKPCSRGPLQQPQPQLSDHLACCYLLAFVVVHRPLALVVQHCSE